MKQSIVTARAAFGGAVTGWICAVFGLLVALGLGGVLSWSGGTKTLVVSVFGVIGCLLGGFRAGLLERSAPLSNGAAAGGLTAVALAMVGVVQDPSRVGGVLFGIFIGASFGTFGAMVSNISARRPR